MAASSPAFADDAAIVSPVHQGQLAPWTGVLLSPTAVAKIVAQHDADRSVLQLELQRQKDVDAARAAFDLTSARTTCLADKAVGQAQLDALQKQNKALQDQLKGTQGGLPPSVWAGIGGLGGLIVGVIVTVVVVKATK